MASKLKKRYLITAAQNGSYVHEEFWASILSYKRQNPGTEVKVLPLRYRCTGNRDWFDDVVEPYLEDECIDINRHINIFPVQHSLPTSANPIPPSIKSVSTHKSMVLPGNQLGMEVVATPHHKLPKLLLSTGVCTERNYTKTPSGARAELWHTFGAIILEVNGDKFHVRQIQAEESTGAFHDLNYKYFPDRPREKIHALGLVTGDTHAQWSDPSVLNATYFDSSSIVKTLKPTYLVWHDLLDFYRRNHHHQGDDLINFAKHHGGLTNVEEEIQLTLDLVDQASAYNNATNIIVPSNHNEALNRWLREANPKVDPENAEFYHRMKSIQLSATHMTETGMVTPDPFSEYAKTYMQRWENTEFLERDQSRLIANNEVGFHGDRGPNGARGSIRNFSRIGVKTIIGHTHAPGIYGSCYGVGTSSLLKLGYNSGPSSWLHTHCVIYPNGTRSLINVIDGDWRM